jgi:hypothetical protein
MLVGGGHAGDRLNVLWEAAMPATRLRPTLIMRRAPHYVSCAPASIPGCYVTLSNLRPGRIDV